MPNFDRLIIGDTNTASRSTRLTTTGAPGGDNIATLIIRRIGQPAGDAALIASSANDGKAGIIGNAARNGVGVRGTAQPIGSNLLSSDVGVWGESFSTGVFGRGHGGMIKESDGRLIASGTGVAGQCASGVGVHGAATSGYGVIGQSVTGAGVTGKSTAASGVAGESQTDVGVQGVSNTRAGVAGKSQNGSGVQGQSTQGIGVHGRSDNSIGVFGFSPAATGIIGDSTKADGIFGHSQQGFGVVGESQQGPAGVLGYNEKRYGLWGHSMSGTGVYADSVSGNAIIGRSGGTANAVIALADAGKGLHAYSNTGTGLHASSGTGLAARFDGDVEVHGSFKVMGGSKSAVVPHRDGSHRQLYCVESPESWFEDFGEARLVKGVAQVRLDSDFAALINTAKYHVFLTSYGRVQLFVHKRSQHGFEIRALPGPEEKMPKSVRCAYRIVARRRDISAPRLAKVKLSQPVKQPPLPRRPEFKVPTAVKQSTRAMTIPTPPQLPPAPVLPKIPAASVRFAERGKKRAKK